MSNSEKIVDQSDSVIELLTAQCADLERLLALAREETTAAERNDFEEILQIVTERTEICRRLETFQHQVSELRDFLGAPDATGKQMEITAHIIEIAGLTLLQDQTNRRLLTAARDHVAVELQNTGKAMRGMNAYLRDRKKGLAYTRNL